MKFTLFHPSKRTGRQLLLFKRCIFCFGILFGIYFTDFFIRTQVIRRIVAVAPVPYLGYVYFKQ
ncbi:MAG: hypothetical protein WCJ45_03680 [bacterium]